MLTIALLLEYLLKDKEGVEVVSLSALKVASLNVKFIGCNNSGRKIKSFAMMLTKDFEHKIQIELRHILYVCWTFIQ
jgi:hypothetical protein